MKILNKSLVTNLLALLLIVISFFLKGQCAYIIKAMGLYAFSGAITNWLAVHMLFEKIPFLYGSGIITNRFEEFKLGIKNLITNQFFTKENILKFLSDGASSFDVSKLKDSVDFDIVFTKLKGAIMESQFGSMLSMFGGEAALEPMKPQFKEKFDEILTEIASSDKVKNALDSQGMSADAIFAKVSLIIDGRLEELTPKMVKDIISDMIREHLGWLVVWGGVFGALIGALTTLF